MATQPRIFKVQAPHMTGEDVKGFQRDLTARYQALGVNKTVAADGDYGNGTRDAAVEVTTALGISPDVMAHGVTPELRIKIRHPETRTPDEVANSQSANVKAFLTQLRNKFKDAGGTLTGIDVYNKTPNIDWKQVKGAGHSFAFHKVSEGLGTPDQLFKARWKAMHDAGLVRGAYHFARPQTGRDPKAEVHEFLGLVKDAGGFQSGDLLPALDLEAFGKAGDLTAAQTLVWARGFVEEVRARSGHRTIIYTGDFWRSKMANPADNLGCPLWLAAYVADPKPDIPKAWAHDSFSIWQYTETGACPGIGGNVDLNRLPGGQAALNRLRI